MNYLIHITDCIKHSSLPDWAIMILAEINTYYDSHPIAESDRGSVLQTIDSMIDNLVFVIRAARTTGDIITTSIDEMAHTLTVYSLTGNRPYLKIGFEPTDMEKIIDPLMSL